MTDISETNQQLKSPWPMRGVMLDAARHTERYEYYEQVIPDLARWGFNTLLLHVADDEGCAIRLKSPRVLPTGNALSIAEWRRLAGIAVEHGLMVIPEIECLGHTGYITRLPENADLREPPDEKGHYWSICPLQPRALEIIDKVITIAADIFPSPWIHLGMDEADIGGSELCQQALQKQPVWQIYGDYTLKLNEIVKSKGRRCMMWGDHILKHTELRDMLPRDITICNWLYGKGHRTDYEQSTLYFLNAGFDLIGCPAGCWGGTLFVPHADNLDNIKKFDEVCRHLNNQRIRGMINTMWASYRYLPSTARPVVAYAGRIFSGEQIEFVPFITGFAADRFEISGQPLARVSAALAALHLERRRTMLEQQLLSNPIEKLAPKRDETERFRTLAVDAENALREAQPAVKAHKGEFEQWLLTAGFLRDMAALRLNELAAMTPDMAGRKTLYNHLRQAFLKYRNYTGTMAEEPRMGQIGRWGSSDHPLEFMLKLVN
jgi:hypothetical protein